MTELAVESAVGVRNGSYWAQDKYISRVLGANVMTVLSALLDGDDLIPEKDKIDGWFYQTVSTLERLTFLGKDAQRRALNILQSEGIIDVAYTGLHKRRYVRINRKNLSNFGREGFQSEAEKKALFFMRKISGRVISRELGEKVANNKAVIYKALSEKRESVCDKKHTQEEYFQKVNSSEGSVSNDMLPSATNTINPILKESGKKATGSAPFSAKSKYVDEHGRAWGDADYQKENRMTPLNQPLGVIERLWVDFKQDKVLAEAVLGHYRQGIRDTLGKHYDGSNFASLGLRDCTAILQFIYRYGSEIYDGKREVMPAMAAYIFGSMLARSYQAKSKTMCPRVVFALSRHKFNTLSDAFVAWKTYAPSSDYKTFVVKNAIGYREWLSNGGKIPMSVSEDTYNSAGEFKGKEKYARRGSRKQTVPAASADTKQEQAQESQKCEIILPEGSEKDYKFMQTFERLLSEGKVDSSYDFESMYKCFKGDDPHYSYDGEAMHYHEDLRYDNGRMFIFSKDWYRVKNAFTAGLKKYDTQGFMSYNEAYLEEWFVLLRNNLVSDATHNFAYYCSRRELGRTVEDMLKGASEAKSPFILDGTVNYLADVLVCETPIPKELYQWLYGFDREALENVKTLRQNNQLNPSVAIQNSNQKGYPKFSLENVENALQEALWEKMPDHGCWERPAFMSAKKKKADDSGDWMSEAYEQLGRDYMNGE